MPRATRHPLYNTWLSMRERCRNPKNSSWEWYGGRGIKVCKEWDSFQRFVSDMGEKPSKDHSLDRVDSNLGYNKENCRWATKREQNRNQRRIVKLTIEGEEYLACELHHATGLKTDTIIKRAGMGMTLEQVTAKTRYTFTGTVRKAIEVRVANQLSATHCKRGHEWTPENTLQQKGGRLCKACYRLRKGITKPRTP